MARDQRSLWQRGATWILLAWVTFQSAWLLALTGAFASRVRPGEVESGVAVALLIVGGLWALDRWVRNAYVGMAFIPIVTVASLYIEWMYYFGGCFDWCRPWLGWLGLPTLAGLAWSSAAGFILSRAWAWTALAVSPITLFFLALVTRGLTLTSFLGVVVPAMAALWISVGVTAGERLHGSGRQRREPDRSDDSR